MEQLHIHCSTSEAHDEVMQSHANDLLQLLKSHNVKVLSPTETNQIASNCSENSSHRASTSASHPAELNIAIVHEHLRTKWIGHVLVALPVTTTTQRILRTVMPWCAPGCVAVTGLQSNGRGRRGAVWESPLGSVAMSIKLNVQITKPESLNFLQYIAALAAVETAKRPWNIPLRVKWPNDIYKDEHKIGGVLCEGVLCGNKFDVIVGVGLNITNREPTTCLLSEDSVLGREVFIGRYLTEFELLYTEYCKVGFEGRLKDKYLEAWMHHGQRVRIGGPEGPRAVVHGLAPNGWVRVLREDTQTVHDLAPEVTSLDMRNGVLKEKLVGPRGQANAGS